MQLSTERAWLKSRNRHLIKVNRYRLEYLSVVDKYFLLHRHWWIDKQNLIIDVQQFDKHKQLYKLEMDVPKKEILTENRLDLTDEHDRF